MTARIQTRQRGPSLTDYHWNWTVTDPQLLETGLRKLLRRLQMINKYRVCYRINLKKFLLYLCRTKNIHNDLKFTLTKQSIKKRIFFFQQRNILILTRYI